MADVFTYKAVNHKFACGNDYTDITVVTFVGPGGVKACAYSCNMNVDLDGEPQAYGPLSKPQLRPKDNLGNAGWRSAAENDLLNAKYKAEKEALAGLEQKRADLMAKAAAGQNQANPAPVPGNPVPAPAKATPDQPLADLDKAIKDQKNAIQKISFEHLDANGNPSKANPKNFEKIFWKWYGVVALTPDQAKRTPPYLEMPALSITLRRPVLDQTAAYEDVFGRFPVVQSVFEPGPQYFVSPVPGGTNPRYPTWDQRSFLPNDATDQTAFGAIAKPLGDATGLDLNDMVFAIRLDTNDTLAFPFRDMGYDYKVAECSFAAFTGLGGEYRPDLERAAKFPNKFLLLYLAFPGRQSPASVLARFSTASNAGDFPVLLSFLAQATVDAKARGSKSVGGDPVRAFEKWKKSPSTPMPTCYDTIVQGLAGAGSNFLKNWMQKHPSLLSGPGLTLNP
jgi:hypothetical protein